MYDNTVVETRDKIGSKNTNKYLRKNIILY